MRKWGLLGLGAAILAAVAIGCAGLRDESSAEPRFTVGAWEYVVRDPDPAAAEDKLGDATAAGFDAVITNTFWAPGQREPSPQEVAELRNAADAAEDADIRPLLIVQNVGSRTTPRTPELRAQFAAYAAAVARQIPAYRDFIIGNEPNLNRFWLPQFGPNGANVAARDYLALLAASYDALKAVSEDIRVIGGALAPRGGDDPRSSRPTHSPTQVHPRPRPVLPGERPRQARDGRVRPPPVPRALEHSARLRPSPLDDDLARRLRQAGRPFGRGVSTAPLRAAPTCRSSTPSSASRPASPGPSSASTRTGARRRPPTPSTRPPRPATTGRPSSSPAARRRSRASTSSTSGTSRTCSAGSPASTTPTTRRSRAGTPCSIYHRAHERPVRRVHLLQGRSGLAAPAGRGAHCRQGRLRRRRRGLGRADVEPARLFDGRRAARRGLLPLEDHRALCGSRRARFGAERHPPRGLPRDAVLVSRNDQGFPVHGRAAPAQGRPEGLARTSSSIRS